MNSLSVDSFVVQYAAGGGKRNRKPTVVSDLPESHYWIIHPDFDGNDFQRQTDPRVKKCEIILRIKELSEKSDRWLNLGENVIVEDASFYWERRENSE
jgi:hypothetical protein